MDRLELAVACLVMQAEEVGEWWCPIATLGFTESCSEAICSTTLNLPSIRKEHEKFDLSGSGGGVAGCAGSGSGSRPNSSSLGWTKPKDGSGDSQAADVVDQNVATESLIGFLSFKVLHHPMR